MHMGYSKHTCLLVILKHHHRILFLGDAQARHQVAVGEVGVGEVVLNDYGGNMAQTSEQGQQKACATAVGRSQHWTLTTIKHAMRRCGHV